MFSQTQYGKKIITLISAALNISRVRHYKDWGNEGNAKRQFQRKGEKGLLHEYPSPKDKQGCVWGSLTLQ